MLPQPHASPDRVASKFARVCESQPGMGRTAKRRAVTRSVGWSLPVIAVSTAAPAHAASCLANLATQAFFPNETLDSNAGGQPTFARGSLLTCNITYRNVGPDVQPAGARVSLTLFHSGYWDSPSISNNHSNIPLTFVGRTEENGVTNLGEPGA